MHFEKITTSTGHKLFLPSQNFPHVRANGLMPSISLRVLLVTMTLGLIITLCHPPPPQGAVLLRLTTNMHWP